MCTSAFDAWWRCPVYLICCWYSCKFFFHWHLINLRRRFPPCHPKIMSRVKMLGRRRLWFSEEIKWLPIYHIVDRPTNIFIFYVLTIFPVVGKYYKSPTCNLILPKNTNKQDHILICISRRTVDAFSASILKWARTPLRCHSWCHRASVSCRKTTSPLPVNSVLLRSQTSCLLRVKWQAEYCFCHKMAAVSTTASINMTFIHKPALWAGIQKGEKKKKTPDTCDIKSPPTLYELLKYKYV